MVVKINNITIKIDEDSIDNSEGMSMGSDGWYAEGVVIKNKKSYIWELNEPGDGFQIEKESDFTTKEIRLIEKVIISLCKKYYQGEEDD